MNLIELLHTEQLYILNFFKFNILFYLLKLLAAFGLLWLVTPVIHKFFNWGSRLGTAIDFILKWSVLYGLAIITLMELIGSYKHIPYHSVVGSILFLFLCIVPMSIQLFNFIKFMALIINKQLKVGDLIHIEHFSGRINKIGLFSVQLYQEDGNSILIPIKHFFVCPVKVIHARNFSIFLKEYPLSNPLHKLKMAQEILFEIKNLPFEMDLENLVVKAMDQSILIDIKFAPAYISGVFSQTIDKLVLERINKHE